MLAAASPTMVGRSLTASTVTVTATLPNMLSLSRALTVMSYTLFPPESAGRSKSGMAANDSTPASVIAKSP